jgi:hypothetical protein
MARLRNLAGGLGGFGTDLIEFALRRMQQQEQSSLVAQRQQELAEQNNAFRAAQADDTRWQQSLQQILNDETGLVAQRLADAGDERARPFVPLGHQVTSRIGASLGKAKREDLPTDVGLEESLRSAPGGAAASTDPRNIQYLIDQRKAREAQLASFAATEATEAGAKSQAMGYGQQAGTNRAVEEFAPTAQRIAVEKEKALNPVMVSRASGEATARQSAETKGFGDRERLRFQIAAEDPAIAASAAAAIQDPTVLDKIDARSRKYVIDAMNSDKFSGAARQQSVKMLNEAKDALEQMWNHPGFAGAVGAKGPSSFFGLKEDPIAGTDASGFVSWYNKFKAAMTLPNIRYMQGLGHMSDVEFGTIAKASTAADRNMPEPEFRRTIAEAYKSVLEALAHNGAPADPKITTQSPLEQKKAALRGR